MIRWLIVFMLALALIGWLTPLLRRIGLGRCLAISTSFATGASTAFRSPRHCCCRRW